MFSVFTNVYMLRDTHCGLGYLWAEHVVNLRSGVPSFFSRKPSRRENKGTPDRRLHASVDR